MKKLNEFETRNIEAGEISLPKIIGGIIVTKKTFDLVGGFGKFILKIGALAYTADSLSAYFRDLLAFNPFEDQPPRLLNYFIRFF